jgi:hypothetical protein
MLMTPHNLKLKDIGILYYRSWHMDVKSGQLEKHIKRGYQNKTEIYEETRGYILLDHKRN